MWSVSAHLAASDYKNTYSAKVKRVAGVEDLSHEIDLCCLWWALSKLLWFDKKVSDLQIETEDVAIGVLETVSGSLCTIRVDYLNTEPTRVVTLHTEHGTIVADYNKNTLIRQMKNSFLKVIGIIPMIKCTRTFWEKVRLCMQLSRWCTSHETY